MKTYHKPATSKLSARFDKELKAILMSDLKNLKANISCINVVNGGSLSAA